MDIRSGFGFANVGATHREFADLVVLAKRWDQRFESATGTYPTYDFAANYRAFTDRVLGAQKHAKELGSIVSYDFSNVASSLWSNYVSATTFTQSRLENMAKRHETFKPYSGGMSTPWGSLLDGIVNDLQRGERMLYAKLLTTPPSTPSNPNNGVPTYPSTPTYPGTPTPLP